MTASGAGAGGSKGDDSAPLLRRGLLALAALGLAGTTVELVFLRHWSGPTQLIVWPGVIVLGIGLALMALRPSRGAVRAVQMLALMAVAVALTGMVLHVHENLDAGPLDRVFAATWDGLAALDQWWLAITGGVGPAPVLAPGALAEIALALLLATVRHPGLSTPA